jgi:F-type H+-transporting ATPase subunit b
MIEINWTLFVQIINFLVLVFLLNVVLFRPIRKSLLERQNTLAAYEAEVNRFLEQSRGISDEINEKLAAARREGVGAREAIRQEGAQAEASKLAAVKQELDARWTEMEKKIKEDMAKARKSLQAQAQNFGQMLAAKILGRELS